MRSTRVERKKPRRKAEPESKRRIAWPKWTGFRGMTVRDWLQLLIVPFALVVIGFLFTMQQDARQQQIENQRAEADRKSTRLNSSHANISYAVFCLKKKKK